MKINKKKFNFILLFLGFLKNQFIKIVKCNLYLKYGQKYNLFKEKKFKYFKLIWELILAKLNTENLKDRCSIKPSKIIFDIKDKELIILDRPIPKFYFNLRDQFDKFHRTPSYLKVDHRSYYQNKSVSRDLFTINNSNLFNLLEDYLNNQMKLANAYGVNVLVSEFLEIPLSFIKNKNKIDQLNPIFWEKELN